MAAPDAYHISRRSTIPMVSWRRLVAPPKLQTFLRRSSAYVRSSAGRGRAGTRDAVIIEDINKVLKAIQSHLSFRNI